MRSKQSIGWAIGGALIFMIGLCEGFTSIVTIGGAAMCAMNINPALVVGYSIPAMGLSLIYGFCLPRFWWSYSLTYALLFLITVMDLVMCAEYDRFATCVLLIALSLVFGFLGSWLRRLSFSQQPEGETPGS